MFFFTVWLQSSAIHSVGFYSGDLGGAVEGRSGEAVHITMMLQVVEQEEVQQVQIVALLGRVVLPVDRRGR